MKLKFTFFTIMALTVLIASCSKDEFNERDAIDAQKELLNLKFQHELDLETLKQQGATALQQLINTAALAQIKLNDSLSTKGAIDAQKQDYSVTVVDAFSNAPVTDADVMVSSQGKVFAAKTNEQGVASFTSLYLFPTSTFLISKTGYAATQILQQNITLGTAKLWNNTELSGEISGTLYIETDLTNITSEKVGANVLVTATTEVPASPTGTYTVYYPAYTTAVGTYSIKLPAATNGYTLTFGQITADQKLYVNATEDDAIPSFPNSLPRLTTLKTYYNVNAFNAPVPSVTNTYYFKVTADKGGKILYLPGYNPNYGYNQILLTAIGDKFQIESIYTSNYYNYPNGNIDINNFTYEPNTKIDVELVDVVGDLIVSAPKLAAETNVNGKLTNTYSLDGGNGYVHLKRDANGVLVADARGLISKATGYNPYANNYNLNFNTSLNTSNTTYTGTGNYLVNKGDKKILNFYYGSGDTREKLVY